MTQISGISDFLTQAGTHYKIFDLGRRIQELSKQTFLAFDQGEAPYPYPLQQQAWLGIMVWHENQSDDLVIWFVKFPLDASGRLTSGIRDDFVYRLINKDANDSTEEANPYGFKPKQENMACFHARASFLLQQPASKFYQHAQDYFAGKPGYDQWAFVGFQGIADIAARLDEADNCLTIINALPHLPIQPLEALCQCLEHESISTELTRAIGQRLESELKRDTANSNLISLLIRALSGSQDTGLGAEYLQMLLDTEYARHPEVLAAISGRCWDYLKQAGIMSAFLENLAQCEAGQEFFNLVIIDLVNIPGIQTTLNSAIRSPERSAPLSKAIGELFRNFTQ
ncbi:MAG: DUF3549 family protein, partial [Gammaproteobacteria bacterium]|nr:DUF3549 family protein [Gammaproteobacteria bacterium]